MNLMDFHLAVRIVFLNVTSTLSLGKPMLFLLHFILICYNDYTGLFKGCEQWIEVILVFEGVTGFKSDWQ